MKPNPLMSCVREQIWNMYVFRVVYILCLESLWKVSHRKTCRVSLFYIHKNFICIYENDSITCTGKYLGQRNKSYNKDIKDIIGENNKHFPKTLQRGNERDIEYIGVCLMENNWEESIPEYRTQILSNSKNDKILRIPDPLFRQIILC